MRKVLFAMNISAQMKSYQKKLPGAVFREIEIGGHQFEGGLGQVARNIRSV